MGKLGTPKTLLCGGGAFAFAPSEVQAEPFQREVWAEGFVHDGRLQQDEEAGAAQRRVSGVIEQGATGVEQPRRTWCFFFDILEVTSVSAGGQWWFYSEHRMLCAEVSLLSAGATGTLIHREFSHSTRAPVHAHFGAVHGAIRRHATRPGRRTAVIYSLPRVSAEEPRLG
jgi:hypothetical protein